MSEYLPNLIIPGAPRAGTTSLCEYLNQHPDIYVPNIKEPRFFISDILNELPEIDKQKHYLLNSSILDLPHYKELYRSSKCKIKVDASVQYLFYHDIVIPKVKEIIGDPYILIVLRNPIDRAYSNYLYNRELESNSFEKEIEIEDQKLINGINSFRLYFKQGLYYKSVKNYIDNFTNVKIILFDDFIKKRDETLNEIFSFLGLISIKKIKKVPQLNKSGIPKNKLFKLFYSNNSKLKKIIPSFLIKNLSLNKKMRFIIRLNSIFLTRDKTTPISAEYRKFLFNLYRADLIKLKKLINRDLHRWY